MPSPHVTDARWLCLAAVPESAGRCRQFVRSTLEHWGLGGAVDDALLLVSELCSNVVRHAGTPMVVGVVWDPVSHLVRVSVRDDSPRMPSLRAPGELATSGRGLSIVRSIAQRWGVQRLPVGKVVWFELRVSTPTHLRRAAG